MTRRETTKWMTREYFAFVKLEVADVTAAGGWRRVEYQMNLNWHTGEWRVAGRDESAWHYDIEMLRENPRVDGKYVSPTRTEMEKGSTNTMNDLKAKAFVMRRVKSIHARMLKCCTDCGGFNQPGGDCLRCREQFKEELERVAAAAENEGMVSPE